MYIQQLKEEMKRDRLEPQSVYAAWAGMGSIYGPAFQAITDLYVGNQQVLAHLRLASNVMEKRSDYVLHPSMMDGAMQAAVGLIDGLSEGSNQPQRPFALDSLRITSPCSGEMVAWVRYAPGIDARTNVVKLDIDLCDERGNICVQMRGISSRGLAKESITNAAQAKTIGSLLAIPVWQAAEIETTAGPTQIAYTDHNIILCALEEIDVGKIVSVFP